jgi:hypothetical protein
MKTQKEIYTWLRANCGKDCLGALTSQDSQALLAGVALTPLIYWNGAPPELFAAYNAIVSQMQPKTRWLAFHAIAIELDWSARFMVWKLAGLPEADMPKFKAAFESGGSAWTTAATSTAAA